MGSMKTPDDGVAGPLEAITLDRFASLLNETTAEPSSSAKLATPSAGAERARSGLARSEPELHWSEHIVVWCACVTIFVCVALFVYFIYIA